MVNLYMKQKVFSWRDRFAIKDAQEQDRYYVEGEIFTIGKKLHLFDTFGNEVAYVQQKVLTFLPRFFVFVNGQQVAEIVKEFTFFYPKYRIEGLGWEVEGDFLAHDYSITDRGREIINIHKVWLAWGDTYELRIADGVNEAMAVAVVLAIDCVIDSQSNQAN